VLVHYSLSEDIRALKAGERRHGRTAVRCRWRCANNRVWGVRERLFERVLPRLDAALLADLLQQAHRVDGIVKGLKQPDWPTDPWQALHRLAMGLCTACAAR
jgi:DNA polymerase-3 subunit delta